jgi:predicted nucleic acid-binding protein
MKKSRQKHYFDACTLEYSTGVYGVIINKLEPNDAIVSHLSLGEACGRAIEKGKDNLDAFVLLIEALRTRIKVVGNDSIDSLIKEIWGEEGIKRISITDAIHLATAIQNGCSAFHTADGDFCNASPDGFKAIAARHNLLDFYIHRMDLPDKHPSSYRKKKMVCLRSK